MSMQAWWPGEGGLKKHWSTKCQGKHEQTPAPSPRQRQKKSKSEIYGFLSQKAETVSGPTESNGGSGGSTQNSGKEMYIISLRR